LRVLEHNYFLQRGIPPFFWTYLVFSITINRIILLMKTQGVERMLLFRLGCGTYPGV
jgi:hypothetical protein